VREATQTVALRPTHRQHAALAAHRRIDAAFLHAERIERRLEGTRETTSERNFADFTSAN
jgi:hypothetical protein